MNSDRKQKPGTKIAALVPPMLIALAFVITAVFIGIREGFLLILVAFAVYSVLSLTFWLRTNNISYLAAFLFQMLLGLFILTAPYGLYPLPDVKMAMLFYVMGTVAGLWLVYLLITRKARWKGREIFELAAAPVRDTVNGFTGRPKPAGKAVYTPEELKGFARFLKTNLIAMPFWEADRVVFVPVRMGDEYRYLFNPGGFVKTKSWVGFDFSGNVTVNITREDYLEYREELSFDQLCENMGKLFIGFLGYFQKGEESRILYTMKQLNLGVLS
jgi:hypothetical protein